MTRHTNAHLNYAGALAGLRRFAEAELAYREALALPPEKAEALWSGLGHMLLTLGRFDDARACLERALELDPAQPDADAGLAFIGQRAGDEEQLRRLRKLLASPDRATAVRSRAGFGLGMLLDNADKYDEAFACFAAPNALHRQQLAASGEVFDLAALRQVDGLIESGTPALYSMVEGDANPSETPVFIVGMPRSGTSLIEQIAATHSRVSGAGELKDIGGTIVEAIQAHGRDRPPEQLNPDLARQLAHGYVAHLQSQGIGAERVIDKMPDNILHLGTIAVLFPKVRIILCRRDLRDICLS